MHASRDRKTVVFGAVGKIWAATGGAAPKRLTNSTDREYAPAISPDGKLIAFRSVDAANQRIKISVMSFADGRLMKAFDIQPTTIIEGDYKVLRWTPDGGGLAYIDTRTGAANIWARPLDGGPERQLTDFKSEQIFKFAWSRDGKHLAVTRGAMMKDVILISGFE